MPDMCPFFQYNPYPREHMNGTILLHVAAVLQNDLSPVAAQSGTWTDVTILSDGNSTGYDGLRMYKSGWMNDGFVAVEFVEHQISFLSVR